MKYKYPAVQSILSILPICDEFIVNVGESEDGTLDLIRSINSPKIKIIETVWDMNQGSSVLSEQTNIALKECRGDWAFYIQADEVVHEADLRLLRTYMLRYLNDQTVDALAFRWLHFYGSHYRYRIDQGWYQKQDRIIRNNGTVVSTGDAFGFRRKDGQPLKRKQTGCLMYHYGWVNTPADMRERTANAAAIGYVDPAKGILSAGYGDLNQFPPYFGTHPEVMDDIIANNPISLKDWRDIRARYWWNPLLWFQVRCKTGKRVKKRIA